MYSCKNCGGNIVFDIPSQKLKCEHCDALFDPYEVEKETDAENAQLFDAQVFTCPQCGAEILASDNSSAEFCLYCGGSTILSSRISKEKRPDYLITFKKTKEDCIKAYKDFMKKALFAPGKLKDPTHLEKFRAIYMPYWTYQVEQKGDTTLKGTRTHRQGDYEITEHYDLNFTLDAGYRGMSHDASSYFSDNMTESLAPYHVNEMMNFTPSLLSGFYADTSDVDSKIYISECNSFANEETLQKVKRINQYRKYSIESPASEQALNEVFHSTVLTPDSTLYPTWFLTYRNEDNVLYAAVNGQTGKVVADIPIDHKKYLITSLILAIPIFFLLNLLFVILPTSTMNWALILNLIVISMYGSEIKEINKRETGEDDRGLAFVRKKIKKKKGNKQENQKTSTTGAEAKSKKNAGPLKVISVILIILFLIVMGVTLFARMENFFGAIIPLVILIIEIICTINSSGYVQPMENNTNKEESIKNRAYRKNMAPYYFSMAASVIACLMFAINPPADWWYYVAALLAGGVVLYSISGIISKYNRLSSHKIPELHDRGGEAHE